jgi:hypothetical protein
MAAGMTFVASVLLFMSDRSRYRDARNGARDMLLTERDMPDAKFCLDFPDIDPKLVCQIRSAIAEFFDTPPEKLHPAHYLSKDDVEALEPMLHSFVVGRVAQERGIPIERFKFTAGQMDIAYFVREVAIIFE